MIKRKIMTAIIMTTSFKYLLKLINSTAGRFSETTLSKQKLSSCQLPERAISEYYTALIFLKYITCTTYVQLLQSSMSAFNLAWWYDSSENIWMKHILYIYTCGVHRMVYSDKKPTEPQETPLHTAHRGRVRRRWEERSVCVVGSMIRKGNRKQIICAIKQLFKNK